MARMPRPSRVGNQEQTLLVDDCTDSASIPRRAGYVRYYRPKHLRLNPCRTRQGVEPAMRAHVASFGLRRTTPTAAPALAAISWSGARFEATDVKHRKLGAEIDDGALGRIARQVAAGPFDRGGHIRRRPEQQLTHVRARGQRELVDRFEAFAAPRPGIGRARDQPAASLDCGIAIPCRSDSTGTSFGNGATSGEPARGSCVTR